MVYALTPRFIIMKFFTNPTKSPHAFCGHACSYLFLVTSMVLSHINGVKAAESFCPTGSSPDPRVIWCDDFESETPLSTKYFDFDPDNGDFSRIDYEHYSGLHSLRARWQTGEVDAGHFAYNFGRNPLGSQSHPNQDFQEIYWRFYTKLQDTFVGYPDKMTRATIFAGSNWQQAMIAHIWSSSGQPEVLLMDPTSGVNNSSQLVTTKWNDFANLIWLGAREGSSPLIKGTWQCVEIHVKLNTPGQADGVMEFWVDDVPQAQRNDLAWVKNWSDYGINSIFFSNYTNAGSPATQERYMDNLVISTGRIGCLGASPPKPPSNVRVMVE